MAMTARDIVKKALQALAILPTGQTMSDEQLADGVTDLNLMIHSWKAKSVDVLHVDLAASDALALLEKYHLGVIALLAVNLAPSYGVEVPRAVVFNASEGWSGIQAAYAVTPTLSSDTALLRTPSQYRPWGGI